jgi:hypothetical protein
MTVHGVWYILTRCLWLLKLYLKSCNGLTEFILLSNYNEENKQLVKKRNDPVRNSSFENDFDYNYDLYYNASTNYSSFQTYTEINIYYVREKQHSELRMLDFSECQYLIHEAVVFFTTICPDLRHIVLTRCSKMINDEVNTILHDEILLKQSPSKGNLLSYEDWWIIVDLLHRVR